jgi:hypothetical protein
VKKYGIIFLDLIHNFIYIDTYHLCLMLINPFAGEYLLCLLMHDLIDLSNSSNSKLLIEFIKHSSLIIDFGTWLLWLMRGQWG